MKYTLSCCKGKTANARLHHGGALSLEGVLEKHRTSSRVPPPIHTAGETPFIRYLPFFHALKRRLSGHFGHLKKG